MGFFQSLKEDLSTAMSELISDNNETNEELEIQVEATGNDEAAIDEAVSSEAVTEEIVAEEDVAEEDVLVEKANDEFILEEINAEDEAATADSSEAEVVEEASVRDALDSMKKVGKRFEEEQRLARKRAKKSEKDEETKELSIENTNESVDVEAESDIETSEAIADSVEPELDIAAILDEMNNDSNGSAKLVAHDSITKNDEEAAFDDLLMSLSDDAVAQMMNVESEKESLTEIEVEVEGESKADDGVAQSLEEVVTEATTLGSDEVNEDVVTENIAEEVAINIPVEEVKENKSEDIKAMSEEAVANDTIAEFSDETAIISKGMTISGNVSSNGNMDLSGTINGDISIIGKLNVTGVINGNSKAHEIYADGAEIVGEINVSGSVKVGQTSVIIGNISATSAIIAGAVKGDIDVQGPVVLDSSAIVMGNIKSMSVQINNGAVIEGMCSQCYATVTPTSFFDDFKKSAGLVK